MALVNNSATLSVAGCLRAPSPALPCPGVLDFAMAIKYRPGLLLNQKLRCMECVGKRAGAVRLEKVTGTTSLLCASEGEEVLGDTCCF